MYMERSEAPLLSPERNQRTEPDERTRRELGGRAVANQCPTCGHELDLPPPKLPGVAMPNTAKEYLREVAAKAANEAPKGLEQSRAVDAVMVVLVEWQNIQSDLPDLANSRV